MIKIYNRSTGQYEIEKVAGEGALKYLYGTGGGKLGLEAVVKKKLYSVLTGIMCDCRVSACKIKGFAGQFNIDLSQCCGPIEEYKTFNHFFTRKLRPEARPFRPEKELLLSPGDGRLRAWAGIDMMRLVQVKNLTYKLGELLADDRLAEAYSGGVCLILRLAPVDYHRFHFIDDGICSRTRKIKGFYYSVNPIALETVPGIFCRNKREYSNFYSKNFGDIIYMEVGATSVGSIVQTYGPDTPVLRGDEKGYFKFGGSTIILFLKKGAAVIDEDILRQTEAGYESKVLAGEAIGRKV